MSLLKKSVNGMVWSFLNSIGVQIITFIVQIILARILVPEIFGLMAIIQIFLTIGLYLVDGGLGSSLIRMKNPSQVDFSTVFFTNILIGVIIYAFIYFTAPIIAKFYSNQSLIELIRFISISIFIRSFAATQMAILTKKMDFKKLALIQIPSTILSGLLGVTLAILNYGIWALVWLNISQAVIFTLSFWFQSSWRPTLVFNRKSFLYHFNFGYKISMTNVLNGVFDNLYNIVIGKIYGLTLLSYYNRAELFQFLPGRILSSTLEKVTFPMFSEIQDDNQKLKETYSTILLLTIFIISPVLLLLTLTAEPLFRFLLTDKWLGIVPYFQGLFIAGLFNPLQRFNLNILRVKNKPGSVFWLNLVRRVIFIIGIVLTAKYNLLLMVYVQSFIMVLTFVLVSYYVGKEIKMSLLQLFRQLLPTFIYLIVWGIFCYYLNLSLNKISNDFLHLIIVFVVGLSLYFVFALILKFKHLTLLKSIYLRTR